MQKLKPENYKVLTTNSKSLSIANVKYYLKQGDNFINSGDFDKAKDSYLDARKLEATCIILPDLNSAFTGVDARIPNEMQRKEKGNSENLS